MQYYLSLLSDVLNLKYLLKCILTALAARGVSRRYSCLSTYFIHDFIYCHCPDSMSTEICSSMWFLLLVSRELPAHTCRLMLSMGRRELRALSDPSLLGCHVNRTLTSPVSAKHFIALYMWTVKHAKEMLNLPKTNLVMKTSVFECPFT